ncbi:MAG: hypothetical protein ACPF9K_06185 [Neptuniibacter sp.]
MFEDLDPLESGENQEYYVSAPDESWQFLLDENGAIKTIFLFFSNGYDSFEGISKHTTREQIFSKYEAPSSKGDEKEIPFLGAKGAWEAYKFPDLALHIEHTVGKDSIEQITLSVPKNN